MKNSILFLVLIASAFLGCNSPSDHKHEAINSEKYGGIFSYNVSDIVKTLFPISIYYTSEVQLVNDVSETLVKMENDMTLSPGLAESWEISEDGLEYVFKLRKGVHFHDDPCFEGEEGREMNAEDVKFCFTKACQNFENNSVSHYLRGILKGADNYFDGKSESVEGIEVLDDFTIKFTLEMPYSEFIPVISHKGFSIFPPEYFEMYSGKLATHLVGTGPFKIAKYQENELIILERNDHYWQKDDEGKSLPYLAGVKVTFEDKNNKTLQKSLNSSVLSLRDQLFPEESKESINAKGYQISKNPIMGTKFIGLYMPNKRLKNKHFRKALQYCIDKDFLVDSVLNGLGKPADSGIIPPIFGKYESLAEIGYEYNLNTAKHSFELSGFSPGNTQDLNIITTNWEEDIAIANVIKDMIEEGLGLNLTVQYFHPDDYYNYIEKGRASLFIDGYYGDYPSPENFLQSLFYGKFVPESIDEFPGHNVYRYVNPYFDSQLDSAKQSQEPLERKAFFQKAEQILMSDAVVVPLYYFEMEYAIDKNIEGFEINPLKVFDLTKVHYSS